MTALICITVFNCSKKIIIQKYYVLETQEHISHQNLQIEKTLPYRIGVRDFQIAKAFEQTRMTLRTKSNEINYYYYHHWAVRPSVGVSEIVCRLIENTHIFKQCSRDYTMDVDYLITGTVYKLERIEKKPFDAAHLNCVIALVDARTELPVSKHEFNRTLRLKNKSMNNFALTISNILRDETEIFVRKAVDYFKKSRVQAQ